MPAAPLRRGRMMFGFLRAGRLPGLRTMKVAGATVVAYAAAELLPSPEPPVVAALTALLVV